MFIPRNLDTRAEDLKAIQSKELQKFETFATEFSNNLKILQNKNPGDTAEQLFVDLLKNCQLKIHSKEYQFTIFIVSDGAIFNIFKYYWKNDWFECYYSFIWAIFKFEFKIPYDDRKLFIANMVQKYFKFKFD